MVPDSPVPEAASWHLKPLTRYRWAITSRTIAAVLGGYVLSAITAAAFSLALPLAGIARVEAVLWATMMAFLLHALAALWCFGCASAWRAWVGVGLPAALALLALWLLPRATVGVA